MDLWDALPEMFAEGQRRWPAVDLGCERFERHCRAVLGPDPSPEVRSFGADLYLCCACVARNPRATLVFERETTPVARAAIARIHKTADFVDETLRELWDKLLFAENAKVAEYSARGSIYAWTRVAAARAAIDRCRSCQVSWGRQADLAEYFVSRSSGPESCLTKARYAGVFQQALDHALSRLPVRDRNLLRMHVCHGCSIDQIGRAHGVHRATAARWLERARRSVFDSVRRQLGAGGTKFTDSEFRSIAHLIRSQLEIDLAGDPQDPAEPRSNSGI